MHPDQVTSEIVEFSNARGIPWAVVPCCVCSKDFPKRKLADGTFVKTHPQFIEWLLLQHPKAQKCTLDFEGKNICVFVAAEDV